MLSQLSRLEEDDLIKVPTYYKDSGKLYHSIGYFDDAAKCIEKAAELYVTRLGNLREAYMCYALAKNYYGDAGDYTNCGLSYHKEMNTKRDFYWKMISKKKKVIENIQYFFKYIGYSLFKILSNYGESINKPLY